MQIDIDSLANGYAGFLVALAGASVTVLTLVLALPEQQFRKQTCYPYLVAALIVSSISCFIGSHLMAEVAALSKDALHPFLLAGPVIYIAAMLFVVSLVILVNVYSSHLPHNLIKLVYRVYFWTTIFACAWIFVMLSACKFNLKIAASLVIVAFLSGYIYPNKKIFFMKQFVAYPFYCCSVVVGFCMVLHCFTSEFNILPGWFYAISYAIGAAFPLGTLLKTARLISQPLKVPTGVYQTVPVELAEIG